MTGRALFVFSHPNHELAVLGHVQRLRPHLLYLTDGGSAERVADTRRSLAALGLLRGVRFLPHPEQAFYDALLRRDVPFFCDVAAAIGETIGRARPHAVYGDAVEYYNPVHDLTLPLLRRALGPHAHATLHEIPLIYQRPGASGRYAVQRLPAPEQHAGVPLALTDTEVDRKIEARDRHYAGLVAQLDGALADLDRAALACEWTRPARDGVVAPDGERFLRYEERGRLRHARGEVPAPITFGGHYAPLVEALLSGG